MKNVLLSYQAFQSWLDLDNLGTTMKKMEELSCPVMESFYQVYHLQTRQTSQQANICNDKLGRASALRERFELWPPTLWLQGDISLLLKLIFPILDKDW